MNLYLEARDKICWLDGQLWIDAAPPPDLVSIFPPGFWVNHFAREAQVEEQIENCHGDKALAIGIGQLFGRRWKRPVPIPLDQSSDRYVTSNWITGMNGKRRDDAWQVIEKSTMRKLTCNLIYVYKTFSKLFSSFQLSQ